SSSCPDDCSSAESGECPTCTIVCHPNDDDCIGAFTSIQDAIDNTTEYDTVLVEPFEEPYYENLILQKSIYLVSRAVFDADTDNGLISDWMGYDDGYEVTNYNISNTIIDGSYDTNGSNFQSVILINTPPDGSCAAPVIKGFTILGGNGTIVTTEDGIQERRGGGFLVNNAFPTFNYNLFVDNYGEIYSGGGGNIDNNVQISSLSGYSWGNSNSCNSRAWLDMRRNAWGRNKASYGKTLSAKKSKVNIDMSKNFWDVYNCPKDEVTKVWVAVSLS
ncbi:uncharacterized protein METZ01_LOCUS417364, partial [marine metagenome]